jgi:hypothetical protein
MIAHTGKVKPFPNSRQVHQVEANTGGVASIRSSRMSALGQKRTFAVQLTMSAIEAQINESLSDHVISAGENRRWNRYIKRLCGLEVDKKLKFRGLFNRKIGGLCPF